MKKKLGTVLYAAPEIFKGNYNEKCDIWAIGCILFIMLSGNMPFADINEIYNGDFTFSKDKVWDSISDLGKKFISDLLIVDYNKRPSAIEAL